MITVKYDKEDGTWVVDRDGDILDIDNHRDLAFLSAVSSADDSETIEVYNEDGSLDFNFEIDEGNDSF